MRVAVRTLGALGLASLAGVAHQLVGAAHFSSTINLGAIVVGFLVVVVGGLFTIRTNVAKIWRENYEAEKAKAESLEKELAAAKAETAEQRDLKHKALGEVAALQLTDQAAVLRELAAIRKEDADARAAVLARLDEIAKP